MAKSVKCLPIQFAVYSTYIILLAHIGVLLRLFLLPFAIWAGTASFLWLYMAPQENSKTDFFVAAGILYIAWLPMIPAVTAWVRFMILGDLKTTHRLHYLIGKAEVTYAMRMTYLLFSYSFTAMIGIVFVVVVIVFLSIGNSRIGSGLPLTAFLAGYGCGFSLITGYLPALPSAAIGSPVIPIETRGATTGNVFRVFANVTLANLPVLTICGFSLSSSQKDFLLALIEWGIGFPVVVSFLFFSYFVVMNTVLAVCHKLMDARPSDLDEADGD